MARVCPHCNGCYEPKAFRLDVNRCISCARAERALLSHWQRRGLGVGPNNRRGRLGVLELLAESP